MEKVHFVITLNHEHCKVFTNHPEFAENKDWNIFGIPENRLCSVMTRIAKKMAELGRECDFRMVTNG